MFNLFRKKSDKISLKKSTKVLYRKNFNEVTINCELFYPAKNKYGIVIYVSELVYWCDTDNKINDNEFLVMKKEIYKYFISKNFSVSIN
jgi:hypothetical protein